jgi:hypothetical protein
VTTRINKNKVQSGYATSWSAPLNHPKFWDQIEDGIKPVVAALRAKGYYTLSSCEGHSLHDYPEVVIAVPSIHWMESVMTLRINLRHCIIESMNPEDYMEEEEDVKPEHKDIPHQRVHGDNSTRNKMPRWKCTEVLNELFDRQYGRYILISIKIPPTVKELPRPLAWVIRNVLGSSLVNLTAKRIDKHVGVFDGE